MGKFFQRASKYIENRMNDDKAYYVIGDAALELCIIASQYHYYVNWYECGILHESNGNFVYEGHDTWRANIGKTIMNFEDALNNNKAFNDIKLDMQEGYNVFAISLKEWVEVA